MATLEEILKPDSDIRFRNLMKCGAEAQNPKVEI